MPKTHWFVPKLHDRNVRRLYHHAHRFSMPVSKLLNLIVAVGLEELSQVNNPDEWEVYTIVRQEEEPDTPDVCRQVPSAYPVAQSGEGGIYPRESLPPARPAQSSTRDFDD
jgi:hypothetical protein